jgi:hypothetical protein
MGFDDLLPLFKDFYNGDNIVGWGASQNQISHWVFIVGREHISRDRLLLF